MTMHCSCCRAMAALLPAAAAHAENKQIKAVLVGTQEVPAISTDGRGSFRARISNDGSAIYYELAYADLEGTVTQAHIHIGQKSVNGGIAAFLCSNLGNGPAGTQACPAATGAHHRRHRRRRCDRPHRPGRRRGRAGRGDRSPARRRRLRQRAQHAVARAARSAASWVTTTTTSLQASAAHRAASTPPRPVRCARGSGAIDRQRLAMPCGTCPAATWSRADSDVVLGIVEEDVGAEGFEERPLGAAAEEQRLVEADAPLAQRADHALVRGHRARGDQRGADRRVLAGRERLPAAGAAHRGSRGTARPTAARRRGCARARRTPPGRLRATRARLRRRRSPRRRRRRCAADRGAAAAPATATASPRRRRRPARCARPRHWPTGTGRRRTGGCTGTAARRC